MSSSDVYGLDVIELGLHRSGARWPMECEVVSGPVRHLRDVPNASEVFYEITGKEPQPRPLGMDQGNLVFDYRPAGLVNYFSRSVTPDSMTATATASILSTSSTLASSDSSWLTFESRFESGNLWRAVRITENYYELYLRPDLYTHRHCQWFYFQVKNMRAETLYRFSIVNLSKPDSLYGSGMKPVLYSEREAQKHNVGWTRIGSNIRYYRNDGYDSEDPTHTLTFTLRFPHDDDTVYLAHCYPYTYSDLQQDLQILAKDELRSRFLSQTLLTRSLAGNNVYLLTITEPRLGSSHNRDIIVISGRVHPGETPSSWIINGIIDFLTSEHPAAQSLREQFVFKIVPMLNPDGVVVGNTRCSLAAKDLNRQYKTASKENSPTIFHFKNLVKRLIDEANGSNGNNVILSCDMHAHSRRFNIFMYGCEHRRGSSRFLQEQVFPLMLHKNDAAKFSFDDCRFRVHKQKETTGRVVYWNMGILCSYTLEASYGGSNLGHRAFTHFNIEDYRRVGKHFCETLLDFNSQQSLKAKIVERLMKEHSLPDEPANIALTDYSSLSSLDDDNEGSAGLTRRQRATKRLRINTIKRGRIPYRGLNKSGSERGMAKDDNASLLFTSSNGLRGPKLRKRSVTLSALPTDILARLNSALDNEQAAKDAECNGRPSFVLGDSSSSSSSSCSSSSDELDASKFDEDEEALRELFKPLSLRQSHLSASSCRRVHSEILESVARIRSTILATHQGPSMASSPSSSSFLTSNKGNRKGNFTSATTTPRCLTPTRRNSSRRSSDDPRTNETNNNRTRLSGCRTEPGRSNSGLGASRWQKLGRKMSVTLVTNNTSTTTKASSAGAKKRKTKKRQNRTGSK